MRASLAAILTPVLLFFEGKREQSRQLSFELEILILLGHHCTLVFSCFPYRISVKNMFRNSTFWTKTSSKRFQECLLYQWLQAILVLNKNWLLYNSYYVILNKNWRKLVEFLSVQNITRLFIISGTSLSTVPASFCARKPLAGSTLISAGRFWTSPNTHGLTLTPGLATNSIFLFTFL